MSDIREYLVSAGDSGSVNISEDVISVVAGYAASEVDGVAALSGNVRDGRGLNGKKSFGHSVKVTLSDEGVAIDISIVAQLGAAVAAVGHAVQEAVAAAVEGACGVAPLHVNVRVSGVRLRA
ncbi:MAG: Asp23/Gls24 family envelope stress response protein [Oscillospiraceae bacterium]|jgi:uncharacterized alkaline shock family protein YloU|nr:Asp23/Gls24 family envelope stress response protein [Oscillospiraceae bacterium]